jgi:DNA polymerase-3 subunit alpha
VIELVVFPRTWTKFQELLQWDNIVLVDGKVDASRNEPKILVDKVTTELDHVMPLPPQPEQQKRKSKFAKKSKPQKSAPPQAEPAPVPPHQQVHEPVDEYKPEWDDADMPPPPEAFPLNWDTTPDGVSETVPPVAEPEPIAAASPVEPTPVADPEPATPKPQKEGHEEIALPETELQHAAETSPAAVQTSTVVETEVTPQSELPDKIPQPIVPPLRSDSAEDVKMVTVILRPRADKARDKLLLRRIFGVMISNPGNDRFAFHIFEYGRGHLLEFPNLTTGVTPELISQLNLLVGSENIRIEPITFQ